MGNLPLDSQSDLPLNDDNDTSSIEAKASVSLSSILFLLILSKRQNRDSRPSSASAFTQLTTSFDDILRNLIAITVRTSWVKFTDPSPVRVKSSRRPPRSVHLFPTTKARLRSRKNERSSDMGSPENSAREGAVRGSAIDKGASRLVEPQEKKKTPKGRAKKRLQYTRRFVNVTLTGGKRKMNPNPTS
ncbi:hypothetical protein FQN50_008072 [Emmonsiellopsis sp. PD_5]|nr:hypothetical protein FQN50_008072 [Emmonsiellopsis sp. PD_5]